VLTVRFINKGMQLVSGSSDGLVRLWTIRTGECENTFDVHTDRVWAVAVAKVPIAAGTSGSGGSGSGTGGGMEEVFFSGGSDSKLLCWRDATEAEEHGRLDEAERTLLVEQQMQNDLRNRKFDKVTVGYDWVKSAMN
jgi:U3 small nucleolar RNA-associated protein 13